MAYASNGLKVMDPGLTGIDASWTMDPSTLPDFNTEDTDWLDSIWTFINSDTAKSLLSLGSGVYGLYESNQMKELAKRAYGASDPFGSQRAGYAQQLAALMKDPGSITGDPGYQFQRDQGEQAIVRQMAAKGYLGSGNMGTALVQYGQDYAGKYLNEKAKFLAELAGAGISPNFGSAISGYASGIDTASQSLASIGYGATIGGGGSRQSRPSSAGGEAAKVGSALSTTGGLLSKTGNTSLGGYASGAGQVLSGVSEGGVKGYGRAISGASNLANLAGYGGTTTEAASAAGNLASGNYLGAAKDLYGLYAGGAAAGGSIAAGLGAGAGSGSIALGATAPTVTGAAGLSTATPGALFGTSGSAAAGAGAGSLGAAGGTSSLGASAGASSTGASAGAMGTLGTVGAAAGYAAALIAAGQLAVKAWGGGGSQTRNLASFEAALGAQLEKKQARVGRTPVNLYKVPGKDFWLTMNQFKDLAGTWYGATFAPDDNREEWQQKMTDVWNNLTPVDLSKYGIDTKGG